MPVAVYLRVSSRSQDTASQEPDLHRYLEAHGLEALWYQDRKTGKTMSRPGFERLMEAVRGRAVSAVVVWRLDRLGRTASGLTALFDELRALKVNLVSLRDGLDLATPAGRLMANVLASVAAFETEVRAERITAGLEVAKVRGVRLGRPPGRAERTKVNAAQVRLIARLKEEGRGVTEIARTLGLSRPTVYSVLAEGR